MSRPDVRRIVAALVLGALVVGCGSISTSARPAGTVATSAPTSTSVSPPTPAPTASTPEPSAAAGPPTACYSLGEPDCARAVAAALAALTPADPSPIYLHVGPFSCQTGERCPTTLAARPEGDVIVEFAGVPAASIHLAAAADGTMAPTRGETFGVILPAGSARLPGPGPIPFDLGHCGLYSGVDVDGSWWDPVGPIDGDHPDAINAAAGTLVFLDATHATFTSKDGLIVQLLRRLGPKHLPMCA